MGWMPSLLPHGNTDYLGHFVGLAALQEAGNAEAYVTVATAMRKRPQTFAIGDDGFGEAGRDIGRRRFRDVVV